jgi:LuxR family transcriptional regulator, maltose regulon positive regulatory protein
MQKADTLIRTKLHLPFIRSELVSRPRLQEVIKRGLQGPLTLITAPAGFGKTTLVASCAAGLGLPIVWLSLDKDDNRTGGFLNYLIASFQEADKRIGCDAAQMLTAAQQISYEAVLTSLINDIVVTEIELIFVLDDYQFISNQSVHDIMAFFLEHFPITLHIVLATRSDPPLSLVKLRARGQVTELRTADLRFTESEASQFLNEVMGLHLDPRPIKTLEDRTEGWISGLQMAALSIRDRKDTTRFIESFSGTNRYILDYLLEEILARQSSEIQRFLLRTSILERLTAPLCEILLQVESAPGYFEGNETPVDGLLQDSTSALEYLERENLFLITLDQDRTWFRYHHLFAELLKARLRQTQPGIIPFLHSQASTWLKQNGFYMEAVKHSIAALQFDQAADLIEDFGPSLWAESDPSVVQMADRLPPDMLISRPKIGLYQAWLFLLQGNVEKTLPILIQLALKFNETEPISDKKWIQTITSTALSFLGRSSITPSFVQLPDYKALDEIPADEVILRDAADILYGMTLGRRGELNQAIEVALQTIQREKTLKGTSAIPSLVPFLARIYLKQGNLNKTAALCHEYLDPIKENRFRFIYSAGSMDIILGEVLYERNQLDEAEKHIMDGLRANESWVDIMTESWGHLALIQVLQAKKDYVSALKVVDKFEERLHGNLRPSELKDEYRTLRVQVELASGYLNSASVWAEQVINCEDFQLHENRYRLTLAHIRLAQGKYSEVEELLQGSISETSAANQLSRNLESKLMLASAFTAQHRLPEALELIESILSLAEPEGYIRVFLNGGEPVRNLLAAYIRTDPKAYKPYTQRILDLFSISNTIESNDHQQVGLIEPLSARELDVLRLMAMGKTNQQIAQQLIVAPGTIKAHAANIFRKLDVANRTEAVARARQLVILS